MDAIKKQDKITPVNHGKGNSKYQSCNPKLLFTMLLHSKIFQVKPANNINKNPLYNNKKR